MKKKYLYVFLSLLFVLMLIILIFLKRLEVYWAFDLNPWIFDRIEKNSLYTDFYKHYTTHVSRQEFEALTIVVSKHEYGGWHALPEEYDIGLGRANFTATRSRIILVNEKSNGLTGMKRILLYQPATGQLDLLAFSQ